MTEEQLATLIEQLGNSRSPKRRSAAKRLRKLGDVAAGPALLDALRAEVQDDRTWETQYQMIMALGECEYRRALPFIEELAARDFDATMIYMAVGDALVRLSRTHEHDAEPAMTLLSSPVHLLHDGAVRAVAMLRMVPSEAQRAVLIDYALQFDRDDVARFWIAAAAAGWDDAKSRAFLGDSANSADADVREAAQASLKGQYRKWSPL